MEKLDKLRGQAELEKDSPEGERQRTDNVLFLQMLEENLALHSPGVDNLLSFMLGTANAIHCQHEERWSLPL